MSNQIAGFDPAVRIVNLDNCIVEHGVETYSTEGERPKTVVLTMTLNEMGKGEHMVCGEVTPREALAYAQEIIRKAMECLPETAA